MSKDYRDRGDPHHSKTRGYPDTDESDTEGGDKLEEYREAFNIFDTDASGYISLEELELVMKKLGQQPSKEDLADMIQDHDTDGNGQIDFDEFVKMMDKNNAEGTQEQKFLEAFKVFDQDGSGKISSAELRDVMVTLGQHLTPDQIEDMICEADCDGDGEIDYNEFVKMMEAQEAHCKH